MKRSSSIKKFPPIREITPEEAVEIEALFSAQRPFKMPAHRLTFVRKLHKDGFTVEQIAKIMVHMPSHACTFPSALRSLWKNIFCRRLPLAIQDPLVIVCRVHVLKHTANHTFCVGIKQESSRLFSCIISISFCFISLPLT